MDLASAPKLPVKSDGSDSMASQRGAVCMLSAGEACDPQFLAEWAALVACASEPNPFFEPWFLNPSLEAFSGNSARISIAAHYTDGTLTGLIPLARSHNYYRYPLPHLSGWLHTNAFYGAPLVARGSERAFWTDLLDHLDSKARAALFCHLPLIERGGQLDLALEAVLRGTGRPSNIALNRQRALHASPLSADEYLAQSLSAKHRKELRRQRRRLADEGELRTEHRTGTFALEEWIAEFLALEAAGWKGNAGSALSGETATQQFFAKTLRGAAGAGKLDRIALRLDGRPIAMLASFITAPGSYSFKTAFDEQYAPHSPGMQLQIDNLEVLGKLGAEWTDSCAAEGHPMIDRLWTERRHLISRNVAIGGKLRRAAFKKIAAFENRRSTQS
uniref:GNAT family N-acetyltransferase n=1 Tax=uncultured Erythrobacter sp. TaxID=263913 RepID=UPI0026181319|nr:GNAT family N-acetyltransferase [uncultured Erythrobacter sp.]